MLYSILVILVCRLHLSEVRKVVVIFVVVVVIVILKCVVHRPLVLHGADQQARHCAIGNL